MTSGLFTFVLACVAIRPFISSLAYPAADIWFSVAFLTALITLSLLKGLNRKLILKFLPPLALFFGSIVLSTVLSPPSVPGILRITMYITGAFMFLTALSFSGEEEKKVLFVLKLAGIVIALCAVYQYFFGFRHLAEYIKTHPADSFTLDYIQRKRVFFPFVTPNILGAYLGMMLPLYLVGKTPFAAIPVLGALLMTGSLGAMGAVLGSMMIFLWYQWKSVRKRYLVWGLMLLLALFALVFVLRLSTPQGHALPGYSASSRINYWASSLELIRQHPLLGSGPGNFNLQATRYAHNSYLQLWAENGLLGIAALGWFLCILFRYLRPAASAATVLIMSASAVFLLENLVDFSFFLPEINLLWWLITGIGARNMAQNQAGTGGNAAA